MARRRRPRSLARRPTNRQIALAVITLVTVIASCVDHALRDRRSPTTSFTHPARTGDDHARYDRRPGTVAHVVDGDTLDVDLGDGETIRVRLLGIDAPESQGPSIEFGRQATSYATARVEGKAITLRLDELARPRDKYQRLLAYVYLADNDMLNDALVRDGWAFAHREYPCDFSGQFEASENAARAARRGMWKTITVGQMPEWRRKWMAKRGLK